MICVYAAVSECVYTSYLRSVWVSENVTRDACGPKSLIVGRKYEVYTHSQTVAYMQIIEVHVEYQFV